MYVDLLRATKSQFDELVSRDDLERYVRERRRGLIALHRGGSYDVDDALAQEVVFDLALIALCVRNGIDAHIEDFARPAVARNRLECALARIGIDVYSSA